MDTVARAKELCEERNLSMYEMAILSHVSYSTLKSAEARGGQLSVDTIEQLCTGLGITLAQFFTVKGS